MTETVMLPSNGNGLVQTDNNHRDSAYKEWFIHAAVKDAHVETAKLALDVKNHVSVESAATRLLVSEHTRLLDNRIRDNEILIRSIQTDGIRSQLQDAKDEVTTLKLAAAAKPSI